MGILSETDDLEVLRSVGDVLMLITRCFASVELPTCYTAAPTFETLNVENFSHAVRTNSKANMCRNFHWIKTERML